MALEKVQPGQPILNLAGQPILSGGQIQLHDPAVEKCCIECQHCISYNAPSQYHIVVGGVSEECVWQSPVYPDCQFKYVAAPNGVRTIAGIPQSCYWGYVSSGNLWHLGEYCCPGPCTWILSDYRPLVWGFNIFSNKVRFNIHPVYATWDYIFFGEVAFTPPIDCWQVFVINNDYSACQASPHYSLGGGTVTITPI